MGSYCICLVLLLILSPCYDSSSTKSRREPGRDVGGFDRVRMSSRDKRNAFEEDLVRMSRYLNKETAAKFNTLINSLVVTAVGENKEIKSIKRDISHLRQRLIRSKE